MVALTKAAPLDARQTNVSGIPQFNVIAGKVFTQRLKLPREVKCTQEMVVVFSDKTPTAQRKMLVDGGSNDDDDDDNGDKNSNNNDDDDSNTNKNDHKESQKNNKEHG